MSQPPPCGGSTLDLTMKCGHKKIAGAGRCPWACRCAGSALVHDGDAGRSWLGSLIGVTYTVVLPNSAGDVLDDGRIRRAAWVQVGHAASLSEAVRMDYQTGQRPAAAGRRRAGRHPVRVLIDLHQPEEFWVSSRISSGTCGGFSGRRHVFAHRQVWGRMHSSENTMRCCASRSMALIRVVKEKLSALDAVEDGDHPEQRGLPAAKAPKREEFAVCDVEGQIRDAVVLPSA